MSQGPVRRATMADVAARAGVSIKTVSRVVNNVPSVDPELARRVRAAAAELHFSRNFAASALRSKVSAWTIGLVIKDLENEFYATIASAVAAVAKANGAQLIMSHSSERFEDELEVVTELCHRRVNGLLIVPTGGDHSSLASEMERGVPMVFIDRIPVNLEADYVVLDNFAGAYAATAKLLAEGHTRIGALIDTLNMATMGRRLNGVRQAFHDRAIPFDESLVAYDVSTPDKAAVRVRELLARPDAPTAFICGNNRSGVGALSALWELGSEAALASFDDFYLSQLMPRPFTVVKYDNRALGTVAAEILFRRIRGEEFPLQSVVLPTHLEARGVRTQPSNTGKERS